ncbi:hypothetical protein QE152_g39833 [Popillia japonica]|uniref:Uncharacterized protein n=1 Tax=Popillia japonica TaxID=7064 RepID=A0AAW1HT25_POPJA
MLLQLCDNGKIFELDVNEDDYERAQDGKSISIFLDIRFAQTLLRHAQILEIIATTSSTHKTSAEDEGLHAETESMESQEQDVKEECEANINSKWSYSDTVTFINSIENYLNYIHHSNPKKRKEAWVGVYNDSESQNIIEVEAIQAVKNERHQQRMKLLERKLAIDERKCQLLEKYLQLEEQNREK